MFGDGGWCGFKCKYRFKRGFAPTVTNYLYSGGLMIVTGVQIIFIALGDLSMQNCISQHALL